MLRSESGRGLLATPPGHEDGAMYSNSSDSNYTAHTPSLASIYQVIAPDIGHSLESLFG